MSSAVSSRIAGFAGKRMVAFVHDDCAATSIEYAVIAAGIAAVIAAVVFGMGNPIVPKYQAASDGFDTLGVK